MQLGENPVHVENIHWLIKIIPILRIYPVELDGKRNF